MAETPVGDDYCVKRLEELEAELELEKASGRICSYNVEIKYNWATGTSNAVVTRYYTDV